MWRPNPPRTTAFPVTALPVDGHGFRLAELRGRADINLDITNGSNSAFMLGRKHRAGPGYGKRRSVQRSHVRELTGSLVSQLLPCPRRELTQKGPRSDLGPLHGNALMFLLVIRQPSVSHPAGRRHTPWLLTGFAVLVVQLTDRVFRHVQAVVQGLGRGLHGHRVQLAVRALQGALFHLGGALGS